MTETLAPRNCSGLPVRAGRRMIPPMPDEPVYRGLTQAELDAQYDQRTLVPDVAGYVARWEARSEAARARLSPREIAYGDDPDEVIDLYPGPGDAPVHLHVHGGAWRMQSRPGVGFVAEGIGQGWRLAVAGFSLAPKATLGRMVDQVRRAALAALALSPSGILVSGHSSGAHLAATLLDPGWQAAAGVSPGAIRGMFLVSGLYDLTPVRLSARNAYLHLDAAEADRLSPIRHLPAAPPPATILWGDGELAEFRRQSADFAERLAALGGRVEAHCLPATSHFDICERFGDHASDVAGHLRALAAEMGKPAESR